MTSTSGKQQKKVNRGRIVGRRLELGVKGAQQGQSGAEGADQRAPEQEHALEREVARKRREPSHNTEIASTTGIRSANTTRGSLLARIRVSEMAPSGSTQEDLV